MENDLKCADLRIGNLLKYEDNIVKVFGLRPHYVEFTDKDEFLVGDNPEYFEPIELTEEVLVKIGFKKFAEHYIMILNGYRIYYNIDKTLQIYKILTDCCSFMKDLEIKCEYIHELQNAYYCLTNEELEVEL